MAGLSAGMVAAVDIAFDDGPLATSPTWTELLDVVEIHIQRGRQSSLGQVEPGRCTVTLRNADRRYDPTNTASPEYGDGSRMEPGKRLQVRVFSGAVACPLFTGNVTAFQCTYAGNTPPGTVTIEAIDALGYLGTRTIAGAFGSAYSDTRMTALLDYLGWPSTTAWRNIAIDRKLIHTQTYAGENALDTIRTIATIGNTLLYITPSGGIWGVNTWQRQLSTLDYTFQDNYTAAELVFDRNEIYNRATITPSSGSAQVVTGSTAARYFDVEYNQALPFTNDSDALALAQYVVNRYQYPRRRIPHLRTTRIALNDDFALVNYPPDAVPTLDIGSRVRVVVTPPTGPAFTSDFFIDGVQHRITGAGAAWEVVYPLSPASYYMAWLLHDSMYGVLGSTTYLG